MSEVLGYVSINSSLGEENGDVGFFMGEAKALPSLCILDFITGGSLNFLKGVKGMPEFESEALVDAVAEPTFPVSATPRRDFATCPVEALVVVVVADLAVTLYCGAVALVRRILSPVGVGVCVGSCFMVTIAGFVNLLRFCAPVTCSIP